MTATISPAGFIEDSFGQIAVSDGGCPSLSAGLLRDSRENRRSWLSAAAPRILASRTACTAF